MRSMLSNKELASTAVRSPVCLHEVPHDLRVVVPEISRFRQTADGFFRATQAMQDRAGVIEGLCVIRRSLQMLAYAVQPSCAAGRGKLQPLW